MVKVKHYNLVKFARGYFEDKIKETELFIKDGKEELSKSEDYTKRIDYLEKRLKREHEPCGAFRLWFCPYRVCSTQTGAEVFERSGLPSPRLSSRDRVPLSNILPFLP